MASQNHAQQRSNPESFPSELTMEKLSGGGGAPPRYAKKKARTLPLLENVTTQFRLGSPTKNSSVNLKKQHSAPWGQNRKEKDKYLRRPQKRKPEGKVKHLPLRGQPQGARFALDMLTRVKPEPVSTTGRTKSKNKESSDRGTELNLGRIHTKQGLDGVEREGPDTKKTRRQKRLRPPIVTRNENLGRWV